MINAPAPMSGVTNSSGLCPLLGSRAVGGNTREQRKNPFVQPVSLVLWNSRSLWAKGNTETIQFVLKLGRTHDLTILTETRESKERLMFLKGLLPQGMHLYSSRLDQYRGGVAILVQQRFLEKFDRQPVWRVFVKGRLARLEFSGVKGCLHVYAIYLSPDDPCDRDKQMKNLADVMDPMVHNIVAGDFNFVENACDRINKSGGECLDNAADRRNATTWRGVAESCHLKEFSQDGFTCENSYGWSRLDRVFTNLHNADLCSIRCACNLLEHPRHLSDHRPVSVTLSMGGKRTTYKSIPPWVTDHPNFKKELIDEFTARCGDFQREFGRPPETYDKIKLLKQSAHRATAYIRRTCQHQIAGTKEHKLAVCMSFLRAVHSQDYQRARALQVKCAELGHLAVDGGLAQSADFMRIKDVIAEWMRSDIQERATELRQVRDSLPEAVYEQRKQGTLNKLKSMIPCASKDIAAMIRKDGSVAVETADIAQLLNDHWQEVFNQKVTNGELRRQWLRTTTSKFRVTKQQLRPSKEVVKKVIAESGSSAPGPDAVPFEVYRSLGEVAVDLFWEAANGMLDGVVSPDGDFNLALMVCVPKSADGVLEDSTPYFTPGGTRPLSIVDASNRILASIFCEVLERRIGQRINRAQKGFLKKRQLLKNVLDVDFAAQKISVQSRSGAIILFDFKAAFPSLSHDMIWDTLEATGVDPSFIQVIKMFYSNNKHILKLRGETFDGITVKSGVRQGCPLSGLLFAMCVDVLLGRLSQILKRDEVVSAFADDIAVVLENLWVSAPALQTLFKEFQEISALTLNVKKTVMIPLWPFQSAGSVSRLLRELCPSWRDLEVASRGRYLGFVIGPNAEADGWIKPLAKFEQRVILWADLRLGMAINIVAFNVFIAPVLEYVAQLLILDDRAHSAMLYAMRKLASGPGTWIELRDLENLAAYGFPANFRSIDLTAKASKYRIAVTIAADAEKKCRELDLVQRENLSRPFKCWHQRAFYRILNDNRIEVERMGKLDAHKECLQHVARNAIQKATMSYNAEFRVRSKMQRWRFEGPEARVACWILQNCATVGRHCRPCVTSTYFRTLWNGWPTSRRMRNLPGSTGVLACQMGCESGKDEIEHYLICPVAWKTLQSHRGIELATSRRSIQSMLLARRDLSLHEIKAIATSVYAISRTVQTLRGLDGAAEPILRLFLQEGLKR